MSQINENYERTNQKIRLLESKFENGNQSYIIQYENIENLKQRIFRLENKLSPEQRVIAFMKSEKTA
jgi:hypothetical protein